MSCSAKWKTLSNINMDHDRITFYERKQKKMCQNFSQPFLWLLKILYFYGHRSFSKIENTLVCQLHFYLPFWTFIGLCQTHNNSKNDIIFSEESFLHSVCLVSPLYLFNVQWIRDKFLYDSRLQPRPFSFSFTYLLSDIFGHRFHYYQFSTTSFIFHIVATGGFHCPVFGKWYDIIYTNILFH